MKIKSSNCFVNMGRRVIGDIPISLIIASGLTVALSLLILLLISSIRIKESIVSEFRLEEELPSLYSSYDSASDEKGNNIETVVRIPITRVKDVTVGLPVLLSFDQSPGSPAYGIIGYVKGVGFQVEQQSAGKEVIALVNVSVDKSHFRVQDYRNNIGKKGKAELIISNNVLGKVIIDSYIDHLPQ